MITPMPEDRATFEVALRDLTIYDNLNPRAGKLNNEQLESLENSDPATWPPIVVSKPEADNSRVLIDGLHRVTVAHKRGLPGLKAVEDQAASDDDLAIAGYEHNLSHGLPLTTKQRCEYARLLIDARLVNFQSEAARKAHVSESTLSEYLNGKLDRTHIKPNNLHSERSKEAQQEAQGMFFDEGGIEQGIETGANEYISEVPPHGVASWLYGLAKLSGSLSIEEINTYATILAGSLNDSNEQIISDIGQIIETAFETEQTEQY